MTRRPPNPFRGPEDEAAPASEDEPGAVPTSPDGDAQTPPQEPPPAAGVDGEVSRPDEDEHTPPRPAWKAEPEPEPESPPPYPRWEAREEPEPSGTATPGRGAIPVFDTLREAVRLINENRVTVLLPLAVVTIPVAIILAVVRAVLFLSVWSNQPLPTTATLAEDGTPGSMLFLLVVLTAVDVLFALVARAAAIVALSGARRGEPPTLTEALDPAFNRIGGILVLLLVLAMLLATAMVLLVTIIGFVLMVYVLLRIGVAFEAYMLEGLGPWEAIGRSWELMRGNMLRLLGLMGLATVIALPFLVLVSLLSEVTGGDRNAEILLVAGWSTLQAVVVIPIVALFTACTTLYYLKARTVEDGTSPA